jgi:hypothetical protein
MSAEEWLLILALAVAAVWVVGAIADHCYAARIRLRAVFRALQRLAAPHLARARARLAAARRHLRSS